MIGDCKFDDGFLHQAFLGKIPSLVQTVLAAVPACATIRELAEIADKVTESHAQPPSVAAVTRTHKMTTPACFLVKLGPYRGSYKTSTFKFIDLKAVVAAVAGTETPVPGLAVALVAVTILHGCAGITGRLGKTLSNAVTPALLRCRRLVNLFETAYFLSKSVILVNASWLILVLTLAPSFLHPQIANGSTVAS